MRAWVVDKPAPIGGRPLRLVNKPRPEPGPNEVRVQVLMCGICRTDLHLAEGDLKPIHQQIVPGHEIVGVIDAMGEQCTRFQMGERIGIAWLRHTCGVCKFCTRGCENLCVAPKFTGWHEDGGYAAYAVVDENYAYSIPEQFSNETAAPLLCAGIIGFRALKRSRLPKGGQLGIYGFGASAHITAQIAIAQGANVHVMTRSPQARELAQLLGAASTGDTFDAPPVALDSSIVFAPAGEIVPAALAATERGGTVALAGIHMSDIPKLDYQQHLFQERNLCSVTANTRQDGQEFLWIAACSKLRIETSLYDFNQASQALDDLANDRVNGVAVLKVFGE